MKILLIASFLLLNACSVYRSQGRKQLESEGPATTTTQNFALESCTKQNAFKAWFQSEFPNRSYEIIFSDPDLEILKNVSADGSIEIRATQISTESRTTCLYRFSDEKSWHQHKAHFIQELENNMMISE